MSVADLFSAYTTYHQSKTYNIDKYVAVPVVIEIRDPSLDIASNGLRTEIQLLTNYTAGVLNAFPV